VVEDCQFSIANCQFGGVERFQIGNRQLEIDNDE